MITELLSAAQSVKVLNDLVQGSLELKKFNDIALALSKVNESLLTAQAAAMKSHAEQSALAEEVRQLKEQIVKMENWEVQTQNYKLQAVAPEVFAYVYAPPMGASEPVHWLCCKCFHDKVKSILQLKYHSMAGKDYTCHHCLSDLHIPNPNPPKINRGGSGGSWMAA